MAVFRGRHKKGNFRGIRKTGKIPFLGLWRSLAAGGSFSGPPKKRPNFRTPKIKPEFQDRQKRADFRGRKNGPKTRFLGPGNKAAF